MNNLIFLLNIKSTFVGW